MNLKQVWSIFDAIWKSTWELKHVFIHPQHYGDCDMITYGAAVCIDFSTKKKVKKISYCEVRDLSKIQLAIEYNIWSKRFNLGEGIMYQKGTYYDIMFAPTRRKNLNLQPLLCDN